jgi:hypothetical protein
MNATTKTLLIQCFTLLSMTVLPIIFCILTENGLHAVIFMAAVVLVYFILYKFPVSCDKCLYAGRMSLSMDRISFWKVRLQYQCDKCGEVVEEDIFYPNITVEVSG